MKQKLSAVQIARQLYTETKNKAFLNGKVIKQSQVERLVQLMLDKYQNFYKERSASRDKGKENVNQNKLPMKRDIDMIGLPSKPVIQKSVEESLGLRDPV